MAPLRRGGFSFLPLPSLMHLYLHSFVSHCLGYEEWHQVWSGVIQNELCIGFPPVHGALWLWSYEASVLFDNPPCALFSQISFKMWMPSSHYLLRIFETTSLVGSVPPLYSIFVDLKVLFETTFCYFYWFDLQETLFSFTKQLCLVG